MRWEQEKTGSELAGTGGNLAKTGEEPIRTGRVCWNCAEARHDLGGNWRELSGNRGENTTRVVVPATIVAVLVVVIALHGEFLLHT